MNISIITNTSNTSSVYCRIPHNGSLLQQLNKKATRGNESTLIFSRRSYQLEMVIQKKTKNHAY